MISEEPVQHPKPDQLTAHYFQVHEYIFTYIFSNKSLALFKWKFAVQVFKNRGYHGNAREHFKINSSTK